jgi:hypothetical protein
MSYNKELSVIIALQEQLADKNVENPVEIQMEIKEKGESLKKKLKQDLAELETQYFHLNEVSGSSGSGSNTKSLFTETDVEQEGSVNGK